MAKLATPISSLFNGDHVSNEIIAKSDCLECREENLASERPWQYLFHFDKDILHLWNDDEKNFINNAASSKKELKLITFHMASCYSRPMLKENIFYAGGKELSVREMLDNAGSNIKWLKTILYDRGIKIALENNNYYPTPAYKYVTEALFIKQAVLENQVMFLFDLAHARITSHNKKEPYEKYIEGLPMDKAVQMHISKYAINENGLAYDAHELPDERIFTETREIMNRFNPEYLTIEYYKDKDQLVRLLEQYRQLCSKTEGAKA